MRLVTIYFQRRDASLIIHLNDIEHILCFDNLWNIAFGRLIKNYIHIMHLQIT